MRFSAEKKTGSATIMRVATKLGILVFFTIKKDSQWESNHGILSLLHKLPRPEIVVKGEGSPACSMKRYGCHSPPGML